MTEPFAGWSLSEAAERTTHHRHDKDARFWQFVEFGRLLVYGCRNGTSTRSWILPAECKSLIFRNYKSSCASSADARKWPIQDLLIYPTLHAPNAADFIDGMLLRDVVSKFVSGDPEVQNLARRATIHEDVLPYYRERPGDYLPTLIWPLVFGPGTLGGGNSGAEEEKYFSDPVSPKAQAAACALGLRFEALLNLLRKNELEAAGDPVHARGTNEIPFGVWSHDRYYWEQTSGDLLQFNDDSDDPLALDHTVRWRAIVVRRPKHHQADRISFLKAETGSWTKIEDLTKMEEAVFIAVKQRYPSGLDGVKSFDRNRDVRKFCEQNGLSVPSDQTIKRAMRKVTFDRI